MAALPGLLRSFACTVLPWVLLGLAVIQIALKRRELAMLPPDSDSYELRRQLGNMLIWGFYGACLGGIVGLRLDAFLLGVGCGVVLGVRVGVLRKFHNEDEDLEAPKEEKEQK